MAGELQAPYRTGETVFATLRNSSALIWDAVDEAFVAYDSGDFANYVIALVEQGDSGIYVGDLPSGIGVGIYSVVAREQAGASPAESDEIVASGSIEWSGSAVVIPSGSEPVTVSVVKDRLQITTSDFDADLGVMIAEARALCEAECGRAFVTQTLTHYLDGFPAGPVVILPRATLGVINSVKYYDADGALQTWASTNYYADAGREPGRLVRKSSVAWPVTEYGRPSVVQIEYTAGSDSIPSAAVGAILVTIADRYENPAGAVGIPPAARRLLDTLETGQVW